MFAIFLFYQLIVGLTFGLIARDEEWRENSYPTAIFHGINDDCSLKDSHQI